MQRRSPFIAVLAAALLGFLTSCSLGGSPNPIYNDKAAPSDVTAVMANTAPPACHLLGNDSKQLALTTAWPKFKGAHIENTQPALSSNPEQYAPQYRCIYGMDAEVSEHELAFGIATAAEKPGSTKLFDYVAKRWQNGETRVNYGDVFHHADGLSTANQKLLAHAQAYLSGDYLTGVVFQCSQAKSSVTIVNKLLLGDNKPSGDTDKANTAAALRFNRLAAAELAALHCK